MSSWNDVLELASRQGVITPADVRALGLAPENLNKLAKLGKLQRLGRGLYRSPDFSVTEQHSYVEVERAVPNGVICLLSALSVHGVGTQMPWEVWVAIPRGQRIPVNRQTQMRAVTMTESSYKLGVDSHTFEGVQVCVYNLEKTIVDCFRLRRLVGHDVAPEALRDAIRSCKLDMSKLTEYAVQLRTWRLMQPYLEALL
jgi:predicted transcriptional regulator of viral defense system